MAPLPRELRRLLENVIIAARDAAEDAARAALRALSVDREEPHSGISDDDRALRVALRARARQLGEFELLVAEVAYEQWHRMLFARFLAENDLLMHPSGVAVSLGECADLAPSEGEADEWMLAARYASQMLPGIFRNEDPSVRVRFARNDVAGLERLLTSLPADAFTADDSLGWVYQFWQSQRKTEVNLSGRLIEAADLAPVTQLFTEPYMVAFLLENSLGAWWAVTHPESPLINDMTYLRRSASGAPLAGRRDNWPATAAEVTLMDPCCGSGHFLVAGFDLLRRMRQEEEGLNPRDAADAVLRDNIHGLELDGRCVQLAVFALALAAWKVGGYRDLPRMNVACSGIPTTGKVEEWRRLAGDDERLADALERMHRLFGDADSLGSLVDPRTASGAGTLLGVEYEEVEPLIEAAMARFGSVDPAARVFARSAEDMAAAARLLAGRYTLVVTNPPYLGRGKQGDLLAAFLGRTYPAARLDLATCFFDRAAELAAPNGEFALVLPQNWLFIKSFQRFRELLLERRSLDLVVRIGEGGFESSAAAGAFVVLVVGSSHGPTRTINTLDVEDLSDPLERSHALSSRPVETLSADVVRTAPESRITLSARHVTGYTGQFAKSYKGMSVSDKSRFVREFWELPSVSGGWERRVASPESTMPFAGRSEVVLFEGGTGALRKMNASQSPDRKRDLQGRLAWGRAGVAVSLMRSLPSTLYCGEKYDATVGVLIPKRQEDLPALAAFALSGELQSAIREVDKSLTIQPGTLEVVPFDVKVWTEAAREMFPAGLPAPFSEHPTQWLFSGRVVDAASPLHVAVARLLGFCWPDQGPDALDHLADRDGIVCIPAVAGERAASDRLRELLVTAYGHEWSESVLRDLLAAEGASDLGAWLADVFFSSHCRLFQNRPFVWHVWDGIKDGFSALVNYHQLDKAMLEKLTYSVLQWWIDRQRSEVSSGTSGAEVRLASAITLQAKLTKIIEGEPPHDIFVRWKPLAEQPVGWEPDVNDGVRVNIRPFVEAGVLRSKFVVNWNKDRGKNVDGSERLNDLHFTISEKLAARGEA